MIKFEFQDTLISILNYQEKTDYIKILVRKSREYRHWLAYIYDNVSFLQLPEFKQNDIKNIDVTTEVHHIVFLDSIVEMVAFKYLSAHPDQVLTSHQLADMVIQLHLEDKIPCIALTKTAHELYHSGNYNLTDNLSGLHKGDYKAFLTEFKDYLSNTEITLLKELGISYEAN